ncbi:MULTISPECIES: NUDIX hydrolase [Spirulina sp. CCY15215]|uniref:NUDIX hydrolase n=1 Tax=Spirulina sp. CCY15215 TaxID=2767591 RepID=UPI00194ECD4F|nr:NUDIX hydrolase [Spirulina major]
MSNSAEQQPWQTHDRLVEINSPWVKLICDRLEDNTGKCLDYWRVEKADSVIILTLQRDRFLLPKPSYRPGIGQVTLDFPGGRISNKQNPEKAIALILKRELGILPEAIQQLTPLNTEGWIVNSSFSNQKLYGFVANLSPDIAIDPELLGFTYPVTSQGIHSLLQQLTCLQCRALLLDYQQSNFSQL